MCLPVSGAISLEIRFGQRDEGASSRIEPVILPRQHLPIKVLHFFNENILYILQLSSLPLPGISQKIFVLCLFPFPPCLSWHSLMNIFTQAFFFFTPSDKWYLQRIISQNSLFCCFCIYYTVFMYKNRKEVERKNLSFHTDRASLISLLPFAHFMTVN